MEILVLFAVALSFLVSASAGLGGSLILVPTLGAFLGPKEGIALAALLLACNNVAKVIAYRQTIPLRPVLGVLVLTVIGAALGARLLVYAPETLVFTTTFLVIAVTFVLENSRFQTRLSKPAPIWAFLSGATSGFSGTSGPLKGIALRSMGLDRAYLVGAASAVSLAGDTMKTIVFGHASLLGEQSWLLVLAATPLMVLATLLGRRFNRTFGERAYATLFWTVMVGYSARLLML